MICEAGEESEEGRRIVRDEPLASSCRCFLKCSRCKARGWYSGTKKLAYGLTFVFFGIVKLHKIYETFALYQ